MATSRSLFRTFILGVASAVIVGSLAATAPTQAASHAGDLQLRGPAGSAYTQGPVVSLVGTEGTTLSWTFRVVNTGGSLAQFLLRVSNRNPGGVAQLYEGTLLLTPLASGPDGYYTRALPPGGSQVLTVKMTIPVGDPVYQYISDIVLHATDGTALDGVIIVAEEAAALSGSTPHDLFLKTGSQKAVTGKSAAPTQISTASTITSTGTATFTATLQNSSGAPSRIGFRLAQLNSCANVVPTVKDGFTNVTAAALNGTYQTPLLGPGGKRNLTVSFKATGGGCQFFHWTLATGPTGTNLTRFAFAVINVASA